jgi:DNA-binding NarL/FixJ family response regulator
MTRIRILLVGLPALLRDILGESLARERDVEILATATTQADLDALVRETRPDVVITGSLGTDAAAIANDIRHVAPSVVVIAIASKGDRATVLSPVRGPLEIADISTDALLKAIRDHCATKDSTKLPPA